MPEILERFQYPLLELRCPIVEQELRSMRETARLVGCDHKNVYSGLEDYQLRMKKDNDVQDVLASSTNTCASNSHHNASLYTSVRRSIGVNLWITM